MDQHKASLFCAVVLVSLSSMAQKAPSGSDTNTNGFTICKNLPYKTGEYHQITGILLEIVRCGAPCDIRYARGIRILHNGEIWSNDFFVWVPKHGKYVSKDNHQPSTEWHYWGLTLNAQEISELLAFISLKNILSLPQIPERPEQPRCFDGGVTVFTVAPYGKPYTITHIECYADLPQGVAELQALVRRLEESAWERWHKKFKKCIKY